MNRYPDQDEDEICKGCPLVKSKPENTPDEIAGYLSIAADLSEVKEIGGRFQYPDGLTPLEWTCLRALERGRGKAETLKMARDRKKPKNGN